MVLKNKGYICILFFVNNNIGDTMNEIINVTLRTLLVLVLIFILFKLMGKKQVSQMSMFDYITGITIGSVVADISLDINKNLTSGIVCLLIYCFIDIIISFISLKSITLRKIICGKPRILVYRGRIDEKALKKEKITINERKTDTSS